MFEHNLNRFMTKSDILFLAYFLHMESVPVFAESWNIFFWEKKT